MTYELKTLEYATCPLAGCHGILLPNEKGELSCSICTILVLSIEDWQNKCHNSDTFQTSDVRLARMNTLRSLFK